MHHSPSSIANQPGDIDKAIEKALGRISLDDFRDKVVAIKPNDTTATAATRRPAPRPTPSAPPSGS